MATGGTAAALGGVILPVDEVLDVQYVYVSSGDDNLQLVVDGSDYDDVVRVHGYAPHQPGISLGYVDITLEQWFNGTQISSTTTRYHGNTYTPMPLMIYGKGGNDMIINDTNARMTAYGGDGNDSALGGGDYDLLFGGPGADFLQGRGGADYLNGMEGNDTLLGGDGDDVLHGGDGNDILYGDAGRDQLYGEWDTDWLSGGDGDDYLDGGNDGLRDSLVGGLGADQFVRHRTNLTEPGGPVIYYNDPDAFVDIITTTGDSVRTIWHYE